MKVGRYKIRRVIGQGSTGKVYLAIDPKLNRDVALKLLRAGITDARLVKRFRLEAKAIAALKHPNIVQLYDYSTPDERQLYLVMEYVKGPSLHQIMSRIGELSEATALCVAYELAQALDHAHENKVVHRDLKPENVLVTEGRVVLTDFGIVKAIDEGNPLGQSVATRTQILGTPGFMAPEQFSGAHIDHRADIYALGALMFNLVTGELPSGGKDIHEIYKNVRAGKVRDPRDFQPNLSSQYCKVIAGCLARKAANRFESMKEVSEALLAVLQHNGVREVRAELKDFQKNPTLHVAKQRERMAEVLLRDLKVAIKDKDEAGAQKILRRMRAIAPAETRMADISGVEFDPRRGPILATQAERSRRTSALWGGLAIGFGLGVAVTYGIGRFWPDLLSLVGLGF